MSDLAEGSTPPCVKYEFADDYGGPCLVCGVKMDEHGFRSGNMIANPGPWACEEFRPLGSTVICRQCGHLDFAHGVDRVDPCLTTDSLIAERDRFRQHSVLLNQIGYTIAVALGKVREPDDYFGDVVADFAELIQLHQKVTLRNLTLEQALDTLGSTPLVALIRALMIDADVCDSNPCIWCGAYAEDDPHDSDCAWLRAKAVIDKAGQ